jgi:Kef-type K+ transport system membrane component KefB
MSPVILFLIQAFILVAVPFAIWSNPRVRQSVPLVVLQILAGMIFGPSFLVRVAPDFAAMMFPAASLERLSGLAWLAALTFTFLTGLHLDISELAKRGRSFINVGVSSVVTPLIFGTIIGVWAFGQFPELVGPKASRISFVLAIGVSVSATALPVLGAILRETGMIYRELGRLALGYAAFNDVMLWVLLIVLSTIAGAPGSRVDGAIAIVPLTLVYFALMFFLLRPLLAWLFERIDGDEPNRTPKGIVLAVSTLLVSALVTEAMGLHYLIGAFTVGAIMPKSQRTSMIAAFEPVCLFLLLPFYFVVTGLKVVINMQSAHVALFFALSVLAAMGGKILGTTIPARISGLGWRDALQLGVLMQCKGFVEIVVLTVLQDGGLISNAAFSALILMAVVTTALTTPMCLALGRPHPSDQPLVRRERSLLTR